MVAAEERRLQTKKQKREDTEDKAAENKAN